MILRYSFLLCLFCLVPFMQPASAQQTFTGRILDSISEEPIPFASIVLASQPKQGVIANIDGLYKIKLKSKKDSILISSVGYFNLKTTASDTIYLKPDVVSLTEVVVYPGENPSHRIINNVIKNADRNNPDNLEEYRCNVYNRFRFDYKVFREGLSDSAYRKQKLIFDSLSLIVESYTDKRYRFKDDVNETILRTKMSGFKQPSISPVASDFQPFHFYKSSITLIDKTYTNPLGPGGTSKYFFLIVDTLYTGRDSVFIIQFKPHKNKNFDALKGTLAVSTNRWAIKTIDVEPAEHGLIWGRLRQQYSFVDSLNWFPVELEFELHTGKYMGNIGMAVIGRSDISNIQFTPNLKKQKFDRYSVQLSDSALVDDDSFWKKHRSFPLTEKEIRSYHLLDSIGRKYKFDYIYHLVEKLIFSRIPVGIIDIDAARLIDFNKYEGNNYGLGLFTNEQLSEQFSVGAYAAYSYKIEKLKYGGSLDITPTPLPWFKLSLAYRHDQIQPGYSGARFDRSENTWRKYFYERMDKCIEYKAAANFVIKYWQINVALRNQQLTPQYAYSFNGLPDSSTYTFTDISVRLRYSFGEKYVKIARNDVSTGSDYPIFYLGYTHGLTWWGGKYEFNQFTFDFSKDFNIRFYGTTSIDLSAGITDRAVPIGRLYECKGSNSSSVPLYVDKMFQAMKPVEFMSDRFVHLFFSHNFKSLLLNTKKFKPELVLVNNVAFGELKNATKHQNIQLQSYEKGYYEGGIIIKNMVRINCKNILYIGFGGGVFRRYGPYSFDKEASNYAYKLYIGISI